MSIHEEIHHKIIANLDKVNQWFEERRQPSFLPIYSSFDIRDSGKKIAPVDANIFPAGFNNICKVDKEHSPALFGEFIRARYPEAKSILLFTEEHTNNAYYLENVSTIGELLESAGYDVRIGYPSDNSFKEERITASGKAIWVHSVHRESADQVFVDGTEVDLIVSNNDFSKEYSQFFNGLKVPMTPSYSLGWYRRRKWTFFEEYNKYAKEFCSLIGINPCLLTVATEYHLNFDVTDKVAIQDLAKHVDEFIERLKVAYGTCCIEDMDPYVFVKNSSGTYGLGVTSVKNGAEVLEWNNKARKKMKATKGGGRFGEVIIQEGIPTLMSAGVKGAAEPALYMVGCKLAGGFLRSHEGKDARESLNSPGAAFKRLCVSDLQVSVEGHPLENVYGWVAKIGVLALSEEARKAYEL